MKVIHLFSVMSVKYWTNTSRTGVMNYDEMRNTSGDFLFSPIVNSSSYFRVFISNLCCQKLTFSHLFVMMLIVGNFVVVNNVVGLSMKG